LATIGLLLGLILAPPSFGQGQDPRNSSKSQDVTTLSLEQLLEVKVISASLHEQSLANAPASVTVITAEEIERFGYRTFAEALAYVRGFYFTSDHTYTCLGVRGFSLPGDYNTRAIVMINGHNIADNIFNQSSCFGNDFPLDIDLVDRIEVVRGTSSALYGSNGMLVTINVITKGPSELAGIRARFETGSQGERKAEVTTALALPEGANLLFSTSAFNNAGAHQLYFSELDSPNSNFGRAIDMDGEKGFHAFADFTWGNWEIQAAASDRVKQQPISYGLSIFNDRGSRAEDSSGFLDVSYTKNFAGDRTLVWRTSYDAYRYRGIYHYYYDERDSVVEDNREHDYGDWIGSTFTHRMPDLWGGHITAGAELKLDLRALINVFDVAPTPKQILRINQPDRDVGVFAQQEWTFGTHWEVNVGARFDWSWLKRSAVSPRAALIYMPSPRTTFKFLASRGFSNPNTYNMFYEDNGLSQVANPALRPEFVNTFEIDFDHQIAKRLSAGTSIYHYKVDNLIQQIYTPTGLIQYVNQGLVRASGVSCELVAHLPVGIELQSSLEFQRAVFGDGTVLPNSPGQVGKFRGSIPFWRNRFTIGAGIQALGRRSTYAGATLPWVILPEAVLSTKSFAGGFQFNAGVKNLSNSFYRDPAGLTPLVDSVIGNGRTYYMNLTWHSSEKRHTRD
jgi:outer membrane receptor for ferrienterochelin and colicins